MSIKTSLSSLRTIRAPPKGLQAYRPLSITVANHFHTRSINLPSNLSSRLARPTLRARFTTTSTWKNGESSTAQASPALTQAEYEEASDRDMNLLHENLEVLVEQYAPDGWEVEYDSGVMTLTLPPNGTYVINKQPPNQQIWMSSPVSGPSRFSYVKPSGKWTHHRKEDVSLGTLLEKEIRGFGVQDGWDGLGVE